MLSLIVAFDKNQGIGKANKMPWHYPEDLAYFRKTTQNHTVAMGKNTFLSIGKALPNRKNVVFTSKPETLSNTTLIKIVTDPVSFFRENEHSDEEIFVIGGQMIYELALPFAKRLYITHIDEVYDVDTYFPAIDLTEYKEIFKEVASKLTFAIYEKE